MKKYIMLSLFVASTFAGHDRTFSRHDRAVKFLKAFNEYLDQEKLNQQDTKIFTAEIMYDEHSDTSNIELLLQISINKAATQEEVDLQILTSIKAASDIRKNSVTVKSLKRHDRLYIDYIDAQKKGMIFRPQNIANSLLVNFDTKKDDATTIFKLCAGNNCKNIIHPGKAFVKEHYFNCKEDGNVQLCSLKRDKRSAKYDEKEPNQAIFDQDNNLMFYLHQIKEETPQ